MSDRKEIHDRVLNANNKDELREAYSEWADTYEHDLVNDMDYVAPTITVNAFQPYLQDRQLAILDAGCGTGLVGALLSEKGFCNVDGVDYSQKMLEKAQQKSVYKNLIQADLTSSLNMQDNQYDAVISVGTFTCAHIGPEAFNELLRVTKPQGYICFTVRDSAWDEDQYHLKMNALENDGLWRRIKVDTENYIEKEGSQCMVCIYQVI